jgi:DNA processing protein
MQLSRTDKVLLHISLISGVGPSVVERLLLRLSAQEFDELYSCSEKALQSLGVPEGASQKLAAGLTDTRMVELELARLEKYGISFISAFNEEYPALLKHTHLPPVGLYVQGELPSDYSRSLAIVGSRKANQYGEQVIDTFVPRLVKEDWLIVSGGALGADALAHAATVRAGGKTIAVIGSGLLKPYPATNRRLFEQIIEHGGAIVSTFPLLMEALAANFPARNRIIAGMTRGCLVVQAAEKSGALITADIALKEGRDVFAVPGSLFDPLSAGCHALLQEGAHCARTAEDILQVYGFAAPAQPITSLERAVPTSTAQVHKPKVPNPALPPFLQFCTEPRSFDDLLV